MTSQRIIPVALFCLTILAGAHRSTAVETKPSTVPLVIDYADGVELRFSNLQWKSKMTALDLLKLAAEHPHGVKFKMRGSGANAFVTQIGDLKNEGGTATSRNWILKVDGKQTDIGAGAHVIEPGQAILWKFEVSDYNQ
jgi:hypothetical protein